LLHLTIERPEKHVRPGLAEQSTGGRRATEAGAATFAIRMRYRGEERTTELPLAHDIIGLLAFEAAFRNVTIGELISELIVAVVNKDLLQPVLEHKKPR
jgi:hypothetical protein